MDTSDISAVFAEIRAELPAAACRVRISGQDIDGICTGTSRGYQATQDGAHVSPSLLVRFDKATLPTEWLPAHRRVAVQMRGETTWTEYRIASPRVVGTMVAAQLESLYE